MRLAVWYPLKVAVIGMKSQKTMLAIAKKHAFESDDIVTDYLDKSFIGYRLTYTQLQRIYFGEGFSDAALKRHISVWRDLGAVRVYNKLIFFIPDKSDVQYSILKTEAARRPDAVLVAEAVA